MPPKTFTDPEWNDALIHAGYSDFNSWWNAEADLVEEGNFRGLDDSQSWSHVSRIKLPDGRTIYLKRQQNHHPNNIALRLQRILTFEIEWRNYLQLQQAGVPTLKFIYFASRKHEGNKQCILVSEELPDRTPLDKLVKGYESNGWPPRKQRLAILGSIVKTIRKLHDAGIAHNALYGRHLYISNALVNGSYDPANITPACLIDLERAKFPGVNSPRLITQDLEKMFRRIPQWPARDGVWFIKQYLNIQKLTPEAKTIIRQIAPSRINAEKN